MFWIFTFGLLTGLALDCCNAQQVSNSKFSCEGRANGYYADVSTGCQVYHMCDGLGRQFSYTCPNATLFQQRMLICDHWYMVNCSRSEDDYSANLLIGQNKPFVEDNESQTFHRTPRPDLLSHPASASEYNIIYRTGKDQDNKNIVGVDNYDNQEDTSSDEPTYFPPSHWSTEYSANKPSRNNFENRRNSNQNNNIYKTNYSTVKKTAPNVVKPKPKAIDFNSFNRNGNTFPDSPKYKTNEFKYSTAPTEVSVNYKSNFKATTPVFPLTVEDYSAPPSELGILPPADNKKSESEINTSRKEENQINFKSEFKATTPVFPLTVEDSSVAPSDLGILPPIPYAKSKTETNRQSENEPSENEPRVNFKSNFKATTPVYPKFVEPRDDNLDTERRISISPERKGIVNFESNFKATTPVYPKFVEPRDDNLDTESRISISPERKGNVNFESNFKATTPVYPTSVEPTSPEPSDVGVVPPESNNKQQDTINIPEKNSDAPELVLSFEPPKFDKNYQRSRGNIETTVNPPSMFYQAPDFDPDFTGNDSNVKSGIEVLNIMKSLNKAQWQNIREKLHIPDYEFPLDEATRPSYDSVLDSFVAKSQKK